jgi:hypothetical protein
MNELTNGVSWAAVISGAVVAYLVGWLWFSERLFGKGWAEGVGVELGKSNDMPMAAMVMQAVGLFLMSWFVSVTAASNLLMTVILGTLAFTVMAGAGSMFRRNSTYSRNVDGGYWIVALVIMVVCNGIF